MKNNQGVLDLTKKTINFKFNDEDFVMDLTEGDLHDSWNSFETKDGVVRDLNFTWDGYSEDDKPVLTVYELTDNEDGTWSTNWQEDTNIKLIKVIGTEGEYFDIPFDGAKTAYFEVFDKDGALQLKTKKFNKACDESVINNWQTVCVDVYGNRKVIGEIREKGIFEK
jgi:hypothetical protein